MKKIQREGQHCILHVDMGRRSVLRFFLRLGLRWMLWTRIRTLLSIMLPDMEGRAVLHFCWRTVLQSLFKTWMARRL
nr:hypothetical protein Iba_scaffold2047CG0040 [Ipomoea batatas]